MGRLVQNLPRLLGTWLLAACSAVYVAAAEPESASEPPKVEGLVFGPMEMKTELELGFRSVVGGGGDDGVYRSQVNLRPGFKLFRSDIAIESPLGSSRLFDRLSLKLDNWGDPYNTSKLRVEKSDIYSFEFNYQKIDYFNFIPSFANPLLAQGILLGQHSFDITRRIMDFTLTIFPGRPIRPYLGYSRNSAFGPALTTFSAQGDEFVLSSKVRNTANDYKLGLEMNFSRLTLLLEQGFRWFKDDQQVSETGGVNQGNSARPVFGRQVFLTNLLRDYHVRGKTPISRVVLKAAPIVSLSLTSRLIYTNADLDFAHRQLYEGNFFSLPLLRFFKGQVESSAERMKRPDIFGDLIVEYRPLQKLKLIYTFQTNRYDISGASDLFRLFLNSEPITGLPQPPSDIADFSASDTIFAFDINRNQFEGLYQLTPKLALRAGYRNTIKDVVLESLERDQTQRRSLSADSNQHVLLAGLGYRLSGKLDLYLDYEKADADEPLVRTAPLDYYKLRVRGRYQPTQSLSITGSLAFFDHQNARKDLDYQAHNRGFDISVAYFPARRLGLIVDYSRSDISSDIIYLLPQTFSSDRSIYLEESNFVNAGLDFELIRKSRLSIGYRVLQTSGTFALNFHQSYAKLSIPINGRIGLTAGWQYYGYNEKAEFTQDYRKHLISSSLVISY